jgi:hypothetical protein
MTQQLPCGCTIPFDAATVNIRMKSETLCIFEGFVPAVEYLTVCSKCYEERYSKYPDLILTDEQEELYLNTKFKED